MAEDKVINNPEVDDEAEYITLEFEDAEDVECEILGIFDALGKEYIALLPQDGSDDVFIYGYKENPDTDEFELVEIESDEEFDQVSAEFEKLSLEEI